MKESKMYKVLFFCPNSPHHLEKFLEDQLTEGLELIAVTDGYFIFKRHSSPPKNGQRPLLKHPPLDRFPFIPEDIPLIEE